MKNPALDPRKAALIEEITKAFEGVSREGGVSLRESRIIDNYGSMAERLEARAKDTETRWQDVADIDIARGESCLSFLDEIGFHYYVPAYATWSLRYLDNTDPQSPHYRSGSFGSLIYALTARYEHDVYDVEDDGSGKLWEHDMARFRMFTPAQSRTIAHFLAFAAEHEDVREREHEQLRQERQVQAGWSQAKIDATRRKAEKFRLKHDLPENRARRALERYWGQFL